MKDSLNRVSTERGNRILNTVQCLEMRTHEGRGACIEDRLRAAGIGYSVQDYGSGKNIIADVGPQGHVVGVGSHYDTVAGSPGANDDASGIAVALDVLERASKDLGRNVGVRGLFFDEEEAGCVGSRAYVRQFGVDNLLGVYNLEMVGIGDKFALWNVARNQSGRLLEALEDQACGQGVRSFRVPNVVTNYADHQPFADAGLEAFTMTSVTGRELVAAPIAGALSYFAAKGPSRFKSFFRGAGLRLRNSCPIFRDYHQPTDTSNKLSPESLQRVSDVLHSSIRASGR